MCYRLKGLGALDRSLVVENGEAWRLFTCMWLHAGVIHLVANMLSLLFIGIRLEQEFGFCKRERTLISKKFINYLFFLYQNFFFLIWAVRISTLYVLSGFGGSLLSSLNLSSSRNPTISVGASGALFGLLGAMLSELLTNWTIYANKVSPRISFSFSFLGY